MGMSFPAVRKKQILSMPLVLSCGTGAGRSFE